MVKQEEKAKREAKRKRGLGLGNTLIQNFSFKDILPINTKIELIIDKVKYRGKPHYALLIRDLENED